MIIGIDASRAALAHHTGTETYAYQLLRGLANLASAETRLRLYTSQPPQPVVWPHSPYIETCIIPFPRLWTHLRLSAEISQHPPDVLFVPSHVLPLHCPVPAVVTVHDLAYRYHPEAYTRFQRHYLDWSTSRHTRVAQHLIADSQATKEDLVNHYQTDGRRISVVHLGRDESLHAVTDVAAAKAVAKAKYDIDGAYILYIGTLQPRKNLLRLIDAFHQVSQQHAVKLVLAGSKGWLYDDIFARVQALNLTEQVCLPGFVAPADKAALISGAEVYAYPSLYEGFGLPILEAMACGTPVLTSNIASMPEVAADAALLVDPYDVAAIQDGLLRLLVDQDLRQSLIHKGFQRLHHFSWANAARKVMAILQAVAHGE
jgi:glycosyltransferase involved in cell wall biosynthesis